MQHGYEERSRLVLLAYKVLNTIAGPILPKTDGELLSDLAHAFTVHARATIDEELDSLDGRRGKPPLKEPNIMFGDKH